MTYTIQYVRLCLRILLPKNEKNQKNENRRWRYAAHSKTRVLRRIN